MNQVHHLSRVVDNVFFWVISLSFRYRVGKNVPKVVLRVQTNSRRSPLGTGWLDDLISSPSFRLLLNRFLSHCSLRVFDWYDGGFRVDWMAYVHRGAHWFLMEDEKALALTMRLERGQSLSAFMGPSIILGKEKLIVEWGRTLQCHETATACAENTTTQFCAVEDEPL